MGKKIIDMKMRRDSSQRRKSKAREIVGVPVGKRRPWHSLSTQAKALAADLHTSGVANPGPKTECRKRRERT